MNRFGRILLPAIATALVALGLPAMASATDYCVHTTCGGTDVDTIEDAFSQAAKADDADRVFLGEGVYTAQSSFGFTYAGSGPIEIIRAGSQGTVLTAPLGAASVLTLKGGPGSSVHDLIISLPQYAQGYGLYTVNEARRIVVSEDDNQSHHREGVVLASGGTLEDSGAYLDRNSDTVAVAFGLGGGTMRGSHANARIGALSLHGNSVIERSRVSGLQYGVNALRNVTTIRSSIVHVIGPYGTGIRADTQGSDTTVNADGVTVTARNLPEAAGLVASTSLDSTRNAEINLTNSIVRVGGASLLAAAAGPGEARVVASYSDYDAARNDTAGGYAKISGSNISNVGDYGFADDANKDLRLSPSSPPRRHGRSGHSAGRRLRRQPARGRRQRRRHGPP